METMNRLAALMMSAGLVLAAPLSQAASNVPSGLMKEARVNEAQARATALAKVSHGTVRSSELEKEHGRLIWTFDIAQPSVKGVTEVHVDAKTGRFVSAKKESALQEAKEARAEKSLTK